VAALHPTPDFHPSVVAWSRFDRSVTGYRSCESHTPATDTRCPLKGTVLSTDESIATDLIRTLENGKEGFDKAAEKLDGSDRPEVATKFREFAQQRATMSDELKAIAGAYGDDVDQRSTLPGALHRGWLAVKDMLTGDDAEAVIGAAETGEDHAVQQYRDALEADISPEFRPVVTRQLASVQSAHDFVRNLKAS
jgi:uncharacterized protein (TIGR02284 family)